MRQKLWIGPLCLAVVVGLSGCNNQQATENENFLNRTGYQSTEKDQLVRNINNEVPMLDDAEDGLHNGNDSYSERDRNYHGHASKPLHAKSSYYNSYEGNLVDRINRQVNSIPNVKDTRAIVMQKDVLVTVLLDDYAQARAIKNVVIEQVQPLVKGRTLHVTTDTGVYYRTMTLDNNLRDGGPTDVVILDADDLFDNLDIHEDHLR